MAKISQPHNGWDWQGPVAVTWFKLISETPRAGCQQLCSGCFWMSLKREILKEWAVGANLPLGLLPAEAVGSWFLEQRSHPGPWSRDNFCGEAQHTDSGCVPSWGHPICGLWWGCAWPYELYIIMLHCCMASMTPKRIPSCAGLCFQSLIPAGGRWWSNLLTCSDQKFSLLLLQ